MGALTNYLENKAAGVVGPDLVQKAFTPAAPIVAKKIPAIVRPIGNEAYGREIYPVATPVEAGTQWGNKYGLFEKDMPTIKPFNRAQVKAFTEPQVRDITTPSSGVVAAGANAVQRNIDNAKAMGVSPAVAANLTPAQKANFAADALPVTMNPVEDAAIAVAAPGIGPLARAAQVPVSAAIEAAPEAAKMVNEKVVQPVYKYMQKNSPLDVAKQVGAFGAEMVRTPLRLIQKF